MHSMTNLKHGTEKSLRVSSKNAEIRYVPNRRHPSGSRSLGIFAFIAEYIQRYEALPSTRYVYLGHFRTYYTGMKPSVEGISFFRMILTQCINNNDFRISLEGLGDMVYSTLSLQSNLA